MRQRKEGRIGLVAEAAVAAASHLIRLETRCNVIRDQKESEGAVAAQPGAGGRNPPTMPQQGCNDG